MNRNCILLLSIAIGTLKAMAGDYKLVSPDGKINVNVTDQLGYTVSYVGTPILTGGVGLEISEGTIKGGIKSVAKKSQIGRVASPFYRADSIKEAYNETTLKLAGNWQLQFRAYNEGVAYRWLYSGKKKQTVIDELVEYSFEGDPEVFCAYSKTGVPGDFDSQLFNSFENTYDEKKLSGVDSLRLSFLPVYVSCGDSAKLVISESDVCHYPGYFLNRSGNALKGVLPRVPAEFCPGGYTDIQMHVARREPFIATLDGAQSLPWRVMMLGSDDKSIASNQLNYLLAEPSAISDISWIKPGKVAWDWWNDWGLSLVNFPAGINNDTYKEYIDFAAANGIEYVILDDGWSDHAARSLFAVIPEINLEELVKYGAERGVGLILWAGYLPFEKDMEEVCKHYSEMGIKGFKVDFLDRNDRDMIDFEQRAAATCAKYHLLLDIHGTHAPAGMNRKWPNVLNFEGVHGLENMKWCDGSVDQMRYDATIPFIRQVSGPMDYTQGAMRNSSRSNYHPSNTEPMSQGTRCHQLALYMILDAPLTMLCDSPTAYRHEQECTDFIASVPTIWNETRVLDGKIGEYIVTARRKGSDWYVGGITSWTMREIEIDFSFLPQGKEYEAVIFADGANAAKIASDYCRAVEKVNSETVKKMKLAPSGGFAISLTPAK